MTWQPLEPLSSLAADGALHPVLTGDGELPVRLERLDGSCAFLTAAAVDAGRRPLWTRWRRPGRWRVVLTDARVVVVDAAGERAGHVRHSWPTEVRSRGRTVAVHVATAQPSVLRVTLTDAATAARAAGELVARIVRYRLTYHDLDAGDRAELERLAGGGTPARTVLPGSYRVSGSTAYPSLRPREVRRQG